MMRQTLLSAFYKLDLESSQQHQELSDVISLTSLEMRKLRKLYRVPNVVNDGAN